MSVEATQPSLVVHGHWHWHWHWHWRHGTDLAWPGPERNRRQTRVEGLGANVDGDVEWATGVLDLTDGGVRVGAWPPLPE